MPRSTVSLGVMTRIIIVALGVVGIGANWLDIVDYLMFVSQYGLRDIASVGDALSMTNPFIHWAWSIAASLLALAIAWRWDDSKASAFLGLGLALVALPASWLGGLAAVARPVRAGLALAAGFRFSQSFPASGRHVRPSPPTMRPPESSKAWLGRTSAKMRSAIAGLNRFLSDHPGVVWAAFPIAAVTQWYALRRVPPFVESLVVQAVGAEPASASYIGGRWIFIGEWGVNPYEFARGALLFVVALMVTLVVAMMVQSLRSNLAVASEEDRRRGFWLVQGSLAGALVLGLGLAFRYAEIVSGSAFLLGRSILMRQFIDIAGLIFVLFLAFALFGRGALDPRLAIRRTTIVGGLGLTFLFLLAGLGNLAEAWVEDVIGVPGVIGTIAVGGGLALALVPLKRRLTRTMDRLFPAK